MARGPDQELEYYATIFRKIRNKKYEFFVISRIVNLLNDRELEFTTQQLIRTEKGRFLLDLYFPQLKLAIEVDESYHARDHQVNKDQARDKAVVDEANVKKIVRIKMAGQSFDDVISKIDNVVSFIKKKKKDLQSAKKFYPFDYGHKYETEYWLKKGWLSVDDDARFRTIVDVAKLFGKKYRGYQRAVIPLENQYSVWLPKLYQNGDWDNKLSRDGKTIEMRKVSGGRFTSNGNDVAKSCVFAHHRDDLGNIYYAFKGVFEIKVQRKNYATFKRVFKKIKFDGHGKVEFVA